MVDGLESENSSLNRENSELNRKLAEQIAKEPSPFRATTPVTPTATVATQNMPQAPKPIEMQSNATMDAQPVRAEEMSLTRLNPTS